jgi:pilus assembly protein CpaB
MGRRTLLLITSILIAAVGTALIGLYVRGANDRAIGDNTVRKVLVAQAPVAGGVTPDLSNFTLQDRRAADLPADFLDSTDQVTGQTVGPIYRGQVLQKAMFSSADSATVTGGIGAGQEGITVELEDPERAAGLLKVGSLIDIFSIINKKVSDPPVVQSAKVIGIGAVHVDSSDDASTNSNAETLPSTLVALTLSRVDIGLVKTAEARGKLFFAVLPGQAK